MPDRTKREGFRKSARETGDDVEGHRMTAREGFHATKREGIETSPEGLKRARQSGEEDDVEGHRALAREGFHATKREGFRATKREGAVEDDVEGHSMLPNAGLSRPLAQARERDIQQHLRRHDLEADARAAKKDRR